MASDYKCRRQTTLVFEVPVTFQVESPVLTERGSCCRSLKTPFERVAQLK